MPLSKDEERMISLSARDYVLVSRIPVEALFLKILPMDGDLVEVLLHKGVGAQVGERRWQTKGRLLI